MGKAIYQPKGKAAEYSKWACNFYNGCSGGCSYCYMKSGVFAKTWSSMPILKTCFKNKFDAFDVFKRETEKNINELKHHGLFFSFISDPFLKESFELNLNALEHCLKLEIPTITLTKQTISVYKLNRYFISSNNNFFGYTLTGFDHLEKGCATNNERIKQAEWLVGLGAKVWFSIEPIIDLKKSLEMINKTKHIGSHYKIGLLSKKNNFKKIDVKNFVADVKTILQNSTIYFKENILNYYK